MHIDPAEMPEAPDYAADEPEMNGVPDDDDSPGCGMSDSEADGDALASAGFGTDEDYCPDTPLGEDFGGE